MTDTLADSYALCRRLTRQAASNFYLGFLVLSRPKRQAMHALYAFLRHTDDLGDGEVSHSAKIPAALDDWQRSLDRALQGEFDAPIFPALVDTIARYDLRPEWLHAVIEGVRQDQHTTRFETFADLERYSFQVAGVVGLCCVRIWGVRGESGASPQPSAIDDLAVTCGLAFQLTNILRDLKEDAARGRIYLPQEDLRRFDYTDDDLSRGVRDERFRELMRFEIDRAERCYDEALQLHAHLSAEGQSALGAMIGVYHELLHEIERRDGDVFSERVQVSAWRKLGIAAWSFWCRRPA